MNQMHECRDKMYIRLGFLDERWNVRSPGFQIFESVIKAGESNYNLISKSPDSPMAKNSTISFQGYKAMQSPSPRGFHPEFRG